MTRTALLILVVLLYHAPVYSQDFVPCPNDPSIPIDDPNCPPDVSNPPPTSSGSLNSNANSFNARYVEEEIRSREEEGNGEDIFDENFGFIFGARTSVYDQDTVDEFIGYESRMKGVFAGLDYRVSPSLFLGAAVDFEMDETDTVDQAGTREMDEFGFLLYSLFYSPNDVYFSLLARYATQNHGIEQSLSKEISFDDAYHVAGTTDGRRINLSAGTGYDFVFGANEAGLSALLEYDRTTIDPYTLSSDSGSIGVGEDERTLLTLSLGGQASRTIGTSVGVFIPSVSLNWFHEFKDDPRTINGIIRPNTLFVEEGQVTIVTPEPDRDYGSFGASLLVILPKGFSTYIYFEENFSRKHVDHWILTVGGRVEF